MWVNVYNVYRPRYAPAPPSQVRPPRRYAPREVRPPLPAPLAQVRPRVYRTRAHPIPPRFFGDEKCRGMKKRTVEYGHLRRDYRPANRNSRRSGHLAFSSWLGRPFATAPGGLGILINKGGSAAP